MDLVVTRFGGSSPSLEPPLMNFKTAGFFLHLLADFGDFLQNCMNCQPLAMLSALGDVFQNYMHPLVRVHWDCLKLGCIISEQACSK